MGFELENARSAQPDDVAVSALGRKQGYYKGVWIVVRPFFIGLILSYLAWAIITKGTRDATQRVGQETPLFVSCTVHFRLFGRGSNIQASILFFVAHECWPGDELVCCSQVRVGTARG